MSNPSFLKMVADDLVRKLGAELSDVTVVFPNNRARLFFNEYLVDAVQRPLWSPSYTTIQMLFSNVSKLQVADTVKLVCDLYKVYEKHMQKVTDESDDFEVDTLDQFYFWGEILLRDFEDVDNNLVNAAQLFQNIKEQAEFIGQYDFLTDEQKEALEHFFRNFSIDENSMLKRRFIRLWNVLFDIYTEFKSNLLLSGFAYEGMLHRQVIEELKAEGLSDFPSKKYVFIGFNVLNECEKNLFSILMKAGKAMFYWDYDLFYMDKKKSYHEAATFMRDNLLQFPNELSSKCFSVFNNDKKITFISASTENAQAKYLDSFLSNLHDSGSKDKDTAVVLCNESLLLPALHSIPEKIKDINVTMGFPLLQAPVYGFIKNLLEMQISSYSTSKNRSFSYSCISPILKDPYILLCFDGIQELNDRIIEQRRFYPDLSELQTNESLTLLFTPVKDPLSLTSWLLNILRKVASFHKKDNEGFSDEIELVYDDLYKEAIFRAYTLINRLHILQEQKELNVSILVLRKLIENMLSTLSVPFTGEPIKGLQIMGFLETRNLDFKNVVMLSVNEGVLPKTGKESSFIPYNLRKGYGMTTIDHKNSLYAYYFYRLMQRAENITMLYDTATNGSNKGQMSRFMMQLLAETNFEVKMQDIRSNIEVVQPLPIQVVKTDEIMQRLYDSYDLNHNAQESFSPSRINVLIDCSLKFYFKFILKLSVPDELNEDIDPSIFGTIFHDCAQKIYDNLGRNKRLINKEDIDLLLKPDHSLENYVDNAFRRIYFNLDEKSTKEIEYTGSQLLNRKVIVEYLRKMLYFDREYTPFSIFGLEREFHDQIELNLSGKSVIINLKGQIDRLDVKEGEIRVVDYKTGGTPHDLTDVDSLFIAQENRAGYILQVLLYASAIQTELNREIHPALMYVNKMSAGYSCNIKDKQQKCEILSVSPYEEDLKRNLKLLFTDLFNQDIPFSRTTVESTCEYCEFRTICWRR